MTLQEIVNSVGVVANIITALLIISGFIMAITKRGKEVVGRWFKKVNEPTNNAILCVLRSEVRNMCKCYIRKGYMTEDEAEDLSEASEAYKDLGGNSYTHMLVERALNLQIRNDIEKNDA